MNTIDLEELTLQSGGHFARTEGVCLLEAVAWMAGEGHSDHPKCVSPVLGAYGRRLNDRLGDEDRQKLKPFIPLMVGTAGDGQDDARRWLASDWAIRVATPRWLDAAGMTARAAELRALPRIVDRESAWNAGDAARAARDEAWAARVKARNSLAERVRAELEKRGKSVADAAAVAAAAAAADAVAAAAADAAAAAAAVADADAVAVAVAVAVAAAAADAVAAAAAVADAVAVAVAVAAAVAAAVADASAVADNRYWAVYDAVKVKLKALYLSKLGESKFAEVARVNNEEAIALLGIMIDPARMVA